jgi:antitoxin component YwqK of YwqJK toxin-antitoxin module
MYFDSNMLTGLCEVFYSDSTLLQSTNYSQNQCHGHSERHWTDGSTAAEEEFVHGSLQHGRYYDREGQLVGSIENGNGWKAIFGFDRVNELHQYCNGIEEGEVRQFGSKGQLLRCWHLKNGCKHGLETEYYPHSVVNGQLLPKWEATWSEGKIHGVVKSWYPDGGQESQREMSNNVKNGLLAAWYRDGALMMMEQYEKDLLIKGEYYRDGERIPCSQVDKGEGVATIYDAEGMFLRKIQYCDSKPFQ